MEKVGESRKGGIPEAKERNAAGKSDSMQTMNGARDSAQEAGIYLLLLRIYTLFKFVYIGKL